MNCTACDYGCPDDPITRSYFGQSSFDLRARQGVSPYTHGSSTTVPISAQFATMLDDGFNYLNSMAFSYGGTKIIDWIGQAGTVVCKPLQHPLGRALDITWIQYSDGSKIDTNSSWKDTKSLGERLQYLALLTAMRIHAKDVLPFYDTNTSHQNHVHVDRVNYPTPPLSKSSPSDVKLIKLIINWQLGWNLPLTGSWTQAAQDGYTYVTVANKTQCWDVFSNYWYTIGFLDIVTKNAISGHGVGWHLGGC